MEHANLNKIPSIHSIPLIQFRCSSLNKNNKENNLILTSLNELCFHSFYIICDLLEFILLK